MVGSIAVSPASAGGACAMAGRNQPAESRLCAGATAGELWAADERGVHRSDDGGKSWRHAVGYATSPPRHLRGLALVP